MHARKSPTLASMLMFVLVGGLLKEERALLERDEGRGSGRTSSSGTGRGALFIDAPRETEVGGATPNFGFCFIFAPRASTASFSVVPHIRSSKKYTPPRYVRTLWAHLSPMRQLRTVSLSFERRRYAPAPNPDANSRCSASSREMGPWKKVVWGRLCTVGVW